ncbi:MAG: hypothetical protein K940chlam1_00643 [Candidatus Anoxychlamydiales bacterium]|nr:hypothetical protein [Candidatus Anoxychlamydiales bacterium]NGX36159.1 hypothetical protein [Candidatus Anoxychlamydiales bacterium]
MTKPVTSQISPSYTKAVTNFWQEEKSPVMKIIKFVGSLFAYLFALPLDGVTQIGQMLSKKVEKPTDKTWGEKIKNFASNHWGKALSAVLLTLSPAIATVLVGAAYAVYDNISISGVTSLFSKTPAKDPLLIDDFPDILKPKGPAPEPIFADLGKNPEEVKIIQVKQNATNSSSGSLFKKLFGPSKKT